jgi:GntR family transcriptional repressor for pyruvate dehydrogenase complex
MAQEDSSGPPPRAGGTLPRLGRARISSLATDTLLSRIVRGVWKPGDKLPSERQLSEQMGMSRASVREAIRSLETMGLVDVRHGQGAFVRDSGESAEDRFFSGWHADHRYPIDELLAFRLLIEPELAALAAEHADATFIAELRTLTGAMEEATGTDDLPLLVQLDTAFHDAITRRAANRLYRDMLDHVAELLIDSRRISLSVPGRAGQVVAAHTAVVDAIATGNPGHAAEAMRRHLDKFGGDMHVRPAGGHVPGKV